MFYLMVLPCFIISIVDLIYQYYCYAEYVGPLDYDYNKLFHIPVSPA